MLKFFCSPFSAIISSLVPPKYRKSFCCHSAAALVLNVLAKVGRALLDELSGMPRGFAFYAGGGGGASVTSF